MGKTEEIGVLTKKVIELFDLSYNEDEPIYCGESNKEHMKSEHPSDYERYGDKIKEIIESPDFIALHPRKKSLEYIKIYKNIDEEYVLVAIRATGKKRLFARTLYVIDKNKFDSYAISGTLRPYK